MSNSSRQIKIGAMVSYMALAINILASLIYLPWMVSMIGKSNYALYSLATSFISLFMLDFGLSSAVSRFVAKYNAEGSHDQVNVFISTVTRLYVIIDVIIFIVLFCLYFFIGQIYTGLTADEIAIFRQLYIIVAINSLISFPFLPLSGILNAYELFIQQKCAELFQKVFAIALTIIVLLKGGDVRALVTVNVVSGIITIGLKLFFVKKYTSVKLNINKFSRSVFSEVAQFSIWVTLMSLVQRCIFNLAPSILGIVSDSTEIALFAPANALEGYFYTISAAVNGLFLATVSRYVANNDEERIFILMVRVGRYQFLVMGIVLVEFFCIGHDFMVCWMGDEFAKAYICALFLFLPDFLIFTQQIANTTVIAKNKVKEQAIGHVIMAISCLALSFPLSRAVGAIGACIAIAVGYSVLFIYMNVLYFKQLRIDVFGFYRECYARLVLPLFVVAGIGFFVCSRIVEISGWAGVILKAIIVGAIYVVVMIFFIDKDEKAIIMRILKIK